MTNEEKINLIGKKILILSTNLDKYHAELEQFKQQLFLLQNQPIQQKPVVVVPLVVKPPEVKTEISEIKMEVPFIKVEEPIKPLAPILVHPSVKKLSSDFNFEAFIGGKLITIIGIIILVIGLGIGVKYAIDNDLLGPLARIVLAYVAGGILLVIALKLKAKYKAFSAVLLSGGMASLYFTTFAAYSMYSIFPQLAAFAIMVVFTTFTVYAATIYELEVIGIIGLVGAYAVPMLLSDGSGKILIMFSYMVIINAGILYLSFKKYWQVLHYIAFGLTWLIVASWFSAKFNVHFHFRIAMVFSFLFFIIFYISNMAYKVIKQEKFNAIDVISIVLNSFIFFAIGYAALDNEYHKDYLGIFTVANALIHFIFAYIVFKNKLLDRKLFYLLIALVLSFITITVPVQLEGNWVTLFWSSEAVLLFYIGRYKAVRFYEWLSYAMILLAIFSLLQDWNHIYFISYYYQEDIYKYWNPFLNIYLFTSIFVSASLASIIYIHHKKELRLEEKSKHGVYRVAEYVLPVLLFIITYCTFSNEISTYFSSHYQQSMITVPSKEVWAESGAVNEVYNEGLMRLKNVALGIYNLVFFCIFSAFVIRKWKANILRWTAFSLNIFTSLGFIFGGLSELGDLRNQYLTDVYSAYFPISGNVLYIRYVCFALFGVLLYLNRQVLRTDTFSQFTIPKIYTGCIVHFFILIVLSNEMVNINHLQNYTVDESYYTFSATVYKLGLTALWGIYSFILIAYGIFRKNTIARISAISLFGITLVKLLTFDTWDLSTGYKVIAYMLLGVMLLIVAFLYTKFKTFIFADEEEKEATDSQIK